MKIKKPSLILAALFLLHSANSSAQTTGLSGFDLHVFRPPADGSGLLNLHGSRTLEQWQFSLGTVADSSHGLLQATNPTTGQSLRVVDDLLSNHFVGAVGITDFFEAGLDIPSVYFEQGVDFNTANPYRTASFGDIALQLKLRLLKDAGFVPGIALVSVTTLPSGSTGKFTGDGSVTEEGKLAIDKKIGPVSLILNGGYRARKRTQVINLDIDDLVTYGAGLAWTLPFAHGSLSLIGEADGQTVLRNRQKLTSPIEWLVGLRQKILEGVSYEIAGGRGITSSVGGGDWRIIAGIHFTSTAPKERAPAEMEPVSSETIHFRLNQSRIRPQDEPVLDRVAQHIKERRKSKLRIRGHADDSGRESYNLDLSRRRAEAVQNALHTRGVEDKRMNIEAVGAREPASPDRTLRGKARNRRVEILEVR